MHQHKEVSMPAKKSPPAEAKTIGVQQLAEHLETDPRTLRAFLRRSKKAVGGGTRYEWKSISDREAKKVIADWKTAQEKEAQPPAS
jgi:transposase